MNNVVKLGLVGCGNISHVHARAALQLADEVRFVACCDVQRSAAETWAATYQAERVYDNYVEMVRCERLDGIVLATWPTQHREQIEQCVEAGIQNILCEKALTLSGGEALEIWNIVTAANIFLTEGFMYRHHPALRKLEALVSQGAIGAVDSIRATFNAFDPEDAPANDSTRDWRQRRETGGGVPYDFACYAVNACGHFAQALPQRVFAFGGISERYGTVNRLYGLIEYANGCIGSIESSKQADFSQELRISGSRGTLRWPTPWAIYGDTAIEQTQSNGWANLLEERYPILATDAYQSQLKNFIDVIGGVSRPVVQLTQSVVNTFVLEALVTSFLEKRAVDIQIPDALALASMEQLGEPL